MSEERKFWVAERILKHEMKKRPALERFENESEGVVAYMSILASTRDFDDRYGFGAKMGMHQYRGRENEGKRFLKNKSTQEFSSAEKIKHEYRLREGIPCDCYLCE